MEPTGALRKKNSSPLVNTLAAPGLRGKFEARAPAGAGCWPGLSRRVPPVRVPPACVTEGRLNAALRPLQYSAMVWLVSCRRLRLSSRLQLRTRSLLGLPRIHVLSWFLTRMLLNYLPVL